MTVIVRHTCVLTADLFIRISSRPVWGLLGQGGANCNDMAGSSCAGTYGKMAFCDVSSKLS